MGYGSKGGALPAERVAAVATPTLVMDGGASPAWMRHSARQVAETLPRGQHRSLERQTHEVAPAALALALAAFVSR